LTDIFDRGRNLDGKRGTPVMKCRIHAFAVFCVIGCSQPGASHLGQVVAATSASSPTDPFSDSSGTVQTFYAAGASVDTSGAFFSAPTGGNANGRSCVSCHVPATGWTIAPSELQARFAATDGLDPVFRTNDGSNSPDADVSTVAARQSAYSMLLAKGLIRVHMPIPANAEFTLTGVDDPYGHASAADLSLFRRPLPTTNVSFLSTVMWDGRETVKGQSVDADLLTQANDATTGHAMAPPLTAAQQRQIVDLEEALFTAQTLDNNARELTAKHALGGPQNLANQPFHVGINDPLGKDPVTSDPPFTPVVFNPYDAWNNVPGGGTDGVRASVARGQAIFNSRPISISNVGGLNSAPTDPISGTFNGTCTTCHDTPNVGDHSVPAPLNIGIADASRRTADLPLYTFTNNTTGDTTQTTDPGRALVTGKWADIGKFKGPILRGLAARPPYFHNGSAATLDDAVNFYNNRFALGLSAQEHADLVAFLQTL
jgi:cytochrome c peroxidase